MYTNDINSSCTGDCGPVPPAQNTPTYTPHSAPNLCTRTSSLSGRPMVVLFSSLAWLIRVLLLRYHLHPPFLLNVDVSSPLPPRHRTSPSCYPASNFSPRSFELFYVDWYSVHSPLLFYVHSFILLFFVYMLCSFCVYFL
ncbi:hypothetical protein BXZ70DRAFT_454055 [Cristinia sonorae]|uniref:Uncharacterized protein n=1 Tax=Cristinia sonorae TaxID=1940300 RepID=A0A8K0UIH8_9AGAR|nr:hypothetical protein BXZ70DRAFT_454055 [Cristinia sonorae]